MKYRNAKYIDKESIDCEIEHPVHGWIPYSLCLDDTDTTINNEELLEQMKKNEDVAPLDIEEFISKLRNVSLSKQDFCTKLADLGCISDDEAINSIMGIWPETFKGFLEYLTPAQQRDSKMTWASSQNIARNDEFVLLLAWWKDISDETLDEMFGLTEIIESAKNG